MCAQQVPIIQWLALRFPHQDSHCPSRVCSPCLLSPLLCISAQLFLYTGLLYYIAHCAWLCLLLPVPSLQTRVTCAVWPCPECLLCLGPPALCPAATPTSLQLSMDCGPPTLTHGVSLPRGPVLLLPLPLGSPLFILEVSIFQTFLTTGCSQKSTSYQTRIAFDIYIYTYITLLCTLIFSILFNLSWYKALFATRDIQFLTQWVTAAGDSMSRRSGDTSREALPSFSGVAWLLSHWPHSSAKSPFPSPVTGSGYT